MLSYVFYTFGWMCWAHGSPHSPVPGRGPLRVLGEAALEPRCREMAAAAPRWGGAASGFRGGAGKMAATKRVLYVGAWGCGAPLGVLSEVVWGCGSRGGSCGGIGGVSALTRCRPQAGWRRRWTRRCCTPPSSPSATSPTSRSRWTTRPVRAGARGGRPAGWAAAP